MKKSAKEKTNTIYGAVELSSKPENVDFINTNDTTKDDVTHFLRKSSEMNVEIGKSKINTSGITKNQNQSRGVLGKFMSDKICSSSMRYSHEKNDNELMSIFNHTESQIKRYGLSGVMPLCTAILDKSEYLLANDPNYTTRTKITAPIILQGRGLMSNLAGYLGQAKNAAESKSTALLNVDAIQKGIFEYNFKNFINDSHFFINDYPDFANTLVYSTSIDALPTQHTGINGDMQDEDGNPVIGALRINLDLPNRKAVQSNNLSFYSDSKFIAGLYRCKFMHPNFVEVIVTLKIIRGQKAILNVVMKKE